MSLEQQLKQLPAEDCKNLLTHLKAVFTHLLTHPQSNVYDAFEIISLNSKSSELKDCVCRLKEDYSEIKDFINIYKQLILKVPVEGEEPQETGPTGYVPNFLEESKLFQSAGIYFGDDECFLILKSLTKLSQMKSTKQVRLWGKILCSASDYYIAEAVVDGGEETELPANVEARGTGVNKFTYFCTTNLLSDWIELPLAYPEHIMAAKKIKYIFTGDLEAKVITNPFFPGKEKNLLRAQIARISFATQIVPVGIFKVNEEDQKEIEPIEQDENFKAPTFQYLTQVENWAHLSNNILKEGRLVHAKPENIAEDQDEETVMKKIEQADPFEQRLRSLARDNSKEGIASSWIVQVKGDKKVYHSYDGKSQKNLGVVVVKSLIWKGFVHIYNETFNRDGFQQQPYNQRFQQNLYVGYGFKSDIDLFFNKMPQVVQDEPQDMDEQFEPRENQVAQAEGEQKEEDA